MRRNTKHIIILAIFSMLLINLSLAIRAEIGSPLEITGFVTGFVGLCYNHMPLFDTYGSFNARESVLFEYNLNVTDQSLGLIYNWSDNSSFFNISPYTGRFSFTVPDRDDDYWVGVHPVIITFDDGIGCLNSIINTTIDINITWMNHPPEIVDFVPIQNMTITEEQPLYFNITFIDPDNDNIFAYDDNNLSVYWYIDGILVKNETFISPRNWSEYTYLPDYNSSGLRVIYVYVNDGEFVDLQYWLVNVTDVYVNATITQPQNGTSLLLFDNYTIFADISVFENRSAINCTITLDIANKTVFDIRPNQSYSHFVDYIGGLSKVTEMWDIYTWNIGISHINVTADCENGGWTYDSKYTISVNASERFWNLSLPEGIYYDEPASLPAAGNYQYKFNITFINLTAHSGRILGCFINQSNCYDSQLPGCRQIFVNKTTLYGIAFYNNSIIYSINDDDIINSTLGGTTDNWIPWQVDRCGLYESNMTPIHEDNTTWRIHVHPIGWTTGDIANSLNAKSAANQYMKNTIRADSQGDVTFSVTKFGGTKVELICNDRIDNPDESDDLIDCADPECSGITYSCLPKQDFINASLHYSPSGSHGTLAASIPPGDIESNISSPLTFNTQIQYTMHAMPNGTFKLRLRKWGLSKTATFFIDGLPDIESVDKYAPGDTAQQGKMLYFLDKNGDPYYSDHLPQSSSYKDRIALRSYLAGGTEIQNLDTVINVSFADPASINMSEGHVVEITINYVEDSTPYEEKINFTIYFDDPTYDNGTFPRWNSTNEREDDIMIAGAGWGPCNDTINADFDFLNCNANEENCFEQSSYDCYDPDCNQKSGPAAWNDYMNISTTGLCAYHNESQTSAMCFDSYNNDWSTEDITLGHNNSGLSLVDCRDIDCDTVTNGVWQCEYNIELTCNDNYDNDMYNLKDCDLQAGGTIDDAEYDCSEFCRNDKSIYSETGVFCDDNIDNDWDRYYTTTGGPDGYELNTSFGAGMDCAWGTPADEDCNMTIMGSGYRCELYREITCNDSFDNDYDNGHGQPDPGWTDVSYLSTFNQTFSESSDYDDYDCQYAPLVPASESINANWCFDNIDNDLDAYYWNSSWYINTTTGKDCADTDCIGTVNPANENQSCLQYEYNSSDPFFDGLPEPDLYCKNGFDDDADGPIDCYDPDCNKQFDMCLACPATENITWNSCADSFDNDYGLNVDCADTDCIGYLGDYDHHICAAAGGENTSYLCSDGFDNDNDGKTDCADPGCNGKSSCSAEDCNDDIDNNGNGLLDCMDPACRSSCNLNTDMSGTYAPPIKSSAIYGNVNVTWDARVRNGTNYTINLVKHEDYNFANIYIGRLTGAALPIGTGLNAPLFSLSGQNASSFESMQYNEDTSHTKAQIEVLDQVPATSKSGFNITIQIPTNNTMSLKSFEYYHSIDGIPSIGHMIDALILDSIKPIVHTVVTEPTAKDSIAYSGNISVAAGVSDQENGDYHDRTIDRCYYSVSGPGGYFTGGDDEDDCVFSFGDMIDDGIYKLTVWARDDTGNYADQVIKMYAIDLKPVYLKGSFNLTDRWYTTGDNLNISAQFNTDDAASISSCTVWYKNSIGSAVFAGNITASNSGDLLTCSGSITSPDTDEMYELWINITDSEGDTAKSASETFFICNDDESSGVGSNGDIWSCVYADINEDGTLDVCEQKEIMLTLKKHDTPDPVRVGDNKLNYTITYINRGYGTAENVTIIERYSENITFLNSTPDPDNANNIWHIGQLAESQNGTIFVTTLTNETLMNGTIVTNIVNLTYYNAANQMSIISIEENTTIIGNTPPRFIKRLPKHHEIRLGDTENLFDLDDYAYDPDLPFGDWIVFDHIIQNGNHRVEITITPDNKVIVKGLVLGSAILKFNVTDSWGEYNISSDILIVVKPAPVFRSGLRPALCIENWKCTQWSECGANKLRYRSCSEENNCKTEINRPREVELCSEIVPATCYDHKRNLGEHGVDCEGPCDMDCCFNGYEDINLGEDGIDCGGRCARKCPIIEKPAPFLFNEMLGVLISFILLLIAMLVPKAVRTIITKEKEIETGLQIIGELERKSNVFHWITRIYHKMLDSVKEPEEKKKIKREKS